MVSLRKRKRMRLVSGESNALVPLPSFWDKEIAPRDPNCMPSNDVIQPERMKETKKPRIKTFAKKSPTKKKKDYLQYRCNMTGFADAMQLYKPTLQQRQDICDELAKTPFWSLLKMYMDDILIATDRKKKSGMDLIKIMQCYNSREQKFKFGDNEAKGITNDDVVQIFGLNNRGVELPNTDKSTKHGKEDPFIDKYFKHAKVVKRKQLIEAYEKSLLDQSPQGAKDTASIICAHLIQSLLFANSGTYITWSFLKICGELDEISKYNWAKGVKDYLLKMINKAQKKKKNRGEEPTISGCTVFVLYWICLHTNVVKTVKGRENMIPAIARWDTSMIHKAIKDVPVEQIKIDGVIPCAHPQEESSKKKQEKTRTKKRKQSDVIPYAQPEDDKLDDHSHQKEEANKDEMAEVDKNLKKKKNKQKRKQNDVEHESININEAQAQFDQLYKEEMSKLDAIHQRYIIGTDGTLSVDLFNEFKSARSIDQKRYLTFKTMMTYALDSSNKECKALRESNYIYTKRLTFLLIPSVSFLLLLRQCSSFFTLQLFCKFNFLCILYSKIPFLSLLYDRNLSISLCCVLPASSTFHFPLLSFSFRFSHPRTEERWKIRVLPFSSTDFSISLELPIASLRTKNAEDDEYEEGVETNTGICDDKEGHNWEWSSSYSAGF